MTWNEPKAKNVKRCPFCSGPVDKYEHLLQCQDCKAIGDLMTGIMMPAYEPEGDDEPQPRAQ